MNFNVEKGGIASIYFSLGIDNNTAILTMSEPYECTSKYHDKRDDIGQIFHKSYYKDKPVRVGYENNLIEVYHGGYSEKVITNLKITIDILKRKSLIDSQRHEEMINNLEQIIARVKIEYEQEVTRYAVFLSDFQSNIATHYTNVKKDLTLLSENKILVNYSIKMLDTLIYDVSLYHGNPTKVKSKWVNLFLCEGALEHLIKSINAEEYNDSILRFKALHQGVASFLQKYEVELHGVIAKTISAMAPWFEELYINYKIIIESGQPPNYDIEGTVVHLKSEESKLYLPSRFAKS
jgi:hypothetical protein